MTREEIDSKTKINCKLIKILLFKIYVNYNFLKKITNSRAKIQ